MTSPIHQAQLKVQPCGIFSPRRMVFDNGISNVQNVVLSQGHFALRAMLNRISRLYERLAAYPQILNTYLDEEVPQLLSEICLHQGIAASVLFDDSPKKYNESSHAFHLRMERFSYVKSFCDKDGIKTPILSNKTVRNQIVHVDDYLVKELRKPNAAWFIDAAVAFRNQFVSEAGAAINFCRCFIAAEEVIVHFGHEISVRGLWTEAHAVLAVVFGIEAGKPPPPTAHSYLKPPPVHPQT